MTAILGKTVTNLTAGTPSYCIRHMYKQARLTKLCNFTGRPDKTDERGVRIIGLYKGRQDSDIQVGHVVKVRICSLEILEIL